MPQTLQSSLKGGEIVKKNMKLWISQVRNGTDGRGWRADAAERIGHSRASLTLDVYSHVMPVTEAPIDALSSMLVRSR
jgi:hypothetical protein